jgi:hypothetical protein
MGTRNLTMVISNGEYKVAQYGQWDGYPSGQGSVVLDFLKNADMKKFRQNIDRCRFIDKSKRKQQEIKNFMKKIGAGNGWMNMEQSRLYQEKYPCLTRDAGAGVLELIYQTEDNDLIWLNDNVDFAADSLFCEWAYLIDLDKNVLEVYRGFNTEPLEEGQRFAKMPKDKEASEYHPIRMIKSYDLNNLPNLTEFIQELEVKEEVEE